MFEKAKQIIVIEDNEADTSVIRDAIGKLEFNCKITHFHDGAEALPALIDQEGLTPDIILLDLNMPRSDGLDVLRTIRNTPRLTYTPVGILTGSRSPGDKLRSSVLGADRYIHKAINYDEYVESVGQAVGDMLSGKKGKASNPTPSRKDIASSNELHQLYIDYRLNILGLRVWKDACQLISKNGRDWGTLGPAHSLPITIPVSPNETTEDWVDELRMTAYQFQFEYPDSDLVDVLTKKKDFSEAWKSASV